MSNGRLNVKRENECQQRDEWRRENGCIEMACKMFKTIGSPSINSSKPDTFLLRQQGFEIFIFVLYVVDGGKQRFGGTPQLDDVVLNRVVFGVFCVLLHWPWMLLWLLF